MNNGTAATPSSPSAALGATDATDTKEENGTAAGTVGTAMSVDRTQSPQSPQRPYWHKMPKSKYVLRTKNLIDTVISSMLLSYLNELDPKEARGIIQEIVRVRDRIANVCDEEDGTTSPRGVRRPLGASRAECAATEREYISPWIELKTPNIRSIINGALLADLIDKTRDYFIEQLEVFIGEADSPQPDSSSKSGVSNHSGISNGSNGSNTSSKPIKRNSDEKTIKRNKTARNKFYGRSFRSGFSLSLIFPAKR